MFQHTAARRRLAVHLLPADFHRGVSTHSRPKAAGSQFGLFHFSLKCFNTQPPEGGWAVYRRAPPGYRQFQHTAARRRLGGSFCLRDGERSFNTQPPEGGWTGFAQTRVAGAVSTHSRPKAAGSHGSTAQPARRVSTHSRPKAAGGAGCHRLYA